jgi:hypothetical protein
MKYSKFALSALTAATLALPMAAAYADNSSAPCAARTGAMRCGTKCAAKCAGKCKAKCKAKCSTKCAPK